MRWSEVAPRAWRLGPTAHGQVWADEEALRIALDALLENAVEYTERDELIELRAGSAGNELSLEVADGGCGIPPEALDRIFDRFGRADDARARTNGGVGLGLSIVATIARAHGGTCTVKSGPSGTVFALRLPSFRPTPRPPSPARSAPSLAELPTVT